MNGTKAVMIYGPQGSGKSLHAEALRKLFGKSAVVEAEDVWPFKRKQQFPGGFLVLTCDETFAQYQEKTHGAQLCSIGAALAALDAQVK